MKATLRLMVISLLMFVAAPAWSDAAVHVFHCHLNDDEAHDDSLALVAEEWLRVAKEQPGGENLELKLFFPIAAQMGEGDFLFVVTTPTFAEMGAFMDAYPDSPLEDVDDDFDQLADCPDSALWESVAVE